MNFYSLIRKDSVENEFYNECLIEAINCHHNDIAHYEKQLNERYYYLLIYK